jgi:ABC-2 type transport system ATP-binding protein
MIVADQLLKDYGALRAVDRVSFRVEPGEVLGFLGPNGAGKSTTMKMITGFLAPTGGTASIGGHDIRSAPLAAKRLLGYLPESGPLYPEMRVSEFLGFIAEVRGLRGSEADRALGRVREICHLEGVWGQVIETLSKGFRQRVGLAQAILHDPACLVLDEPTDGLDPNQKSEVRRLLAGMAESKAVILSTHILEEVEAMCNRVIIIARGRVLVDETPAALRERHPRAHALRLRVGRRPAEEVAASVRDLREVARVEASEDGLLVFPRHRKDLKAELWALARERAWEVEALENVRAPLDEVFRELTLQSAS